MKPVEVIDGRKVCSGCHEWKSLEDFYVRRGRAAGAGRMSRCRACERARRASRSEAQKIYVRAHYKANRQRYNDYGLRRYGLTRERYDAMLAAQDGLCALCGQAERTLNKSGEVRALGVDHDHACCSGKKSCGDCIRGLLCAHCNVALGSFEDSVERLLLAIAYLEKRRNGALLKAVG